MLKTPAPVDLRQAYLDARAGGAVQPGEIAAVLGVSEGALLDAHVGAPAGALQAQRLRPDFGRLLSELSRAGELLAQTGHAHGVQECVGVYERLGDAMPPSHEFSPARGDEIDLRPRLACWAQGYAVREAGPRGEVQSLQFFDAAGRAVHKVFAQPATLQACWQALRVRWIDALVPAPCWQPHAPAEVPAPAIDAAAWRAAWAGLRDAQQLDTLLLRHGLRRLDALRLAAPQFAQRVDDDAARMLLSAAAASGTPLLALVSSAGGVQARSGCVASVGVERGWLQVMAPRFRLALREAAIAEAWAVRRPGADGVVSSLELYAADGEPILRLLGQRKPGEPERWAWRDLIDAQVDDPIWREEATSCAA